MNSYIVWIEMDKAKIFTLSVDGNSSKILHRHQIKHHTSRDPKNHKDCEKFFHEISTYLEGAQDILLMGPSLTKEHFKAHLERHHHETLAKRIVGMKTTHFLGDGDLLAYSREFFKQHDLFEHPIAG